MQETFPKSAPSARLIWLSLTLLLLVLAVSCSGCAQRSPQPSPPVLFNPARIQAPDPILMQQPLPPGTYSASAQERLSRWESRLKTLPSESAGSKPGPALP